MELPEVIKELKECQDKIDVSFKRGTELSQEKKNYTQKLESGDIGQELYTLRMSGINFEYGLVKETYNEDKKEFNRIKTIYDILKCFEYEGKD